MPSQFISFNGVEPTTAARVAVATGTSIKTLMQVATPSTKGIVVIEWGISFDASVAATPGKVELIETDVAATSGTSVTPTKWGQLAGDLSLCVGGTGATNHSPTVEGTITAVRSFDTQLISPTNQYVKQFALGREPFVPASKFLRVRVHFGATVNAICYVIWEE